MHDTKMTKLIKFIELIRPPLLVVPAALGTVGVFLSYGNLDFVTLLLGAVIPCLIWAGGLIFNDYFDIESDTIANPERPIASGVISKQEAVIYGSFINILCLVLAFSVNINCFLVTLIAVILKIIYPYLGYIKREGILRNLSFGLAVGLCILIGSTITGEISLLVITVTIIGILIYTSDNIIGRFPDIEVDEKMGVKTLPMQIGLKPASMIAFILTFIAFLLTMLLWLLGLHISYLPTACIAGMSLLILSLAVFMDPKGVGHDLSIVFLRYMGQLLLCISFIIGVGFGSG